MNTLLPIITLLVVVSIGFIVIRVGAVALILTGLAHELAHFQALSAFLGVGFTTSEAEQVVTHPVRRQIIRWLIIIGNAGVVATISSMIPVFMSAEGGAGQTLPKLVVLFSGLVLLWLIARSEWIDRQMSRIIGWALKRWTKLDVRDYQGLLRLSSGYAVIEMLVEEGEWISGKTLAQLRLNDEGVQVLGVRRAGDLYIGAPRGTTKIHVGDTLTLYGLVEHLEELEHRRADAAGDKLHEMRVQEMNTLFMLQQQRESLAKEHEG